MSENALLLHARNVGRRVPDKEDWLLRHVTLTLAAGQRLAIVGSTGSGKTLLLRALALLDPVDEGEILWQGEPISDVPAFRCRVVYLHQRPALFEGNVEANLRLPLTLRVHRGRRFDRQRLVALLNELGREESFLQQPAAELSGGEAQIAALLRVVQLDPDVLLLDEPTAALDTESAKAVERLIERWWQEGDGQRAYVWVSHQRDQVERIAEHILTMHNGRLAG